MKGYIIRKALQYIRQQMPDLREFWSIARNANWVDVGPNGDTVECLIESIKYVCEHGRPGVEDVRKALGK